ncbi:MAG: hypothetical protein C0175_01995 [Caldisericum exile]|uniref:Uncharacterized protein n=1 Tax=Caldisericum exile TaxID=693075 RepID=A0A2J6X875_9BACT|nr:MAG: hypothetical protein C0175_01995 [Caldisericum exile]
MESDLIQTLKKCKEPDRLYILNVVDNKITICSYKDPTLKIVLTFSSKTKKAKEEMNEILKLFNYTGGTSNEK